MVGVDVGVGGGVGQVNPGGHIGWTVVDDDDDVVLLLVLLLVELTVELAEVVVDCVCVELLLNGCVVVSVVEFTNCCCDDKAASSADIIAGADLLS